jgi:hypothetical protein
VEDEKKRDSVCIGYTYIEDAGEGERWVPCSREEREKERYVRDGGWIWCGDVRSDSLTAGSVALLERLSWSRGS